MYAVIKTGGKQYRVAQDDVLTIERLDGEAGNTIEFTEVLMVGSGSGVKIGTPTVPGAKVTAELVEQTRGRKIIAFKKRRRKNSRRKRGHRQELTTVKIKEIVGAWGQFGSIPDARRRICLGSLITIGHMYLGCDGGGNSPTLHVDFVILIAR